MVIQFYIPKLLNYDDIQRIVISIEVTNPYSVESPTNMYFKRGRLAKVSSGDYNQKAYDLWNAGKGFILQGTDLCQDCYFTILIESDENAFLIFQSQAFTKLQAIKPY